METKEKIGTGVKSYSIENISIIEADEMVSMKNHLCDILLTHTKQANANGVKKEYLSLNDMKMLYAMFATLTSRMNVPDMSSFKIALKNVEKLMNAGNKPSPDEDFV